MGTSITIEEIIGIDHAVDVLSRDGSIEQRQLEELMTIQSFTVRAAYPNDAQCIAGISPDAEGMASFHPVGRLRQLTHSLRLQKGVYAMAERELLSWVLICSFRIGGPRSLALNPNTDTEWAAFLHEQCMKCCPPQPAFNYLYPTQLSAIPNQPRDGRQQTLYRVVNQVST